MTALEVIAREAGVTADWLREFLRNQIAIKKENK